MNGVAAASKYPAELKERAVAMARELEWELGPGRGAIARVAAQLDIHPEALRYWVRRDEAGHPPAGTAQLAVLYDSVALFGLCGQLQVESGEVAGVRPVQGCSGPPCVQADHVERGGGENVSKACLG
jgi:transposase-like protein